MVNEKLKCALSEAVRSLLHVITFRIVDQVEGFADEINCSQVGRRRVTRAGAARNRSHYFHGLTTDL